VPIIASNLASSYSHKKGKVSMTLPLTSIILY
jgi:hypothetical protein